MKNIVKLTHTETYCLKAHHKIRVISLSDFHFGRKMKIQKIEKVLHLIDTLKPDYIFWLGDNLDTTNVLEHDEKKQEFLNLCKTSGQLAPTMISLADHDRRLQLENEMIEDDQTEFWNQVSNIPNVHVLDNCIYEDEYIYVVGYTLPGYYYHRKYLLPQDSSCEKNRKDEDVNVLLEDMVKHRKLLECSNHKVNELLFHSPLRLDNIEVQKNLQGFDHIYSGHMHEGLTPPVLDELVPKTFGMVSPQRSLFPKNARGVIETQYGSIGIINGGITKIAEGNNVVLQPFNAFFPMHMDIVDIDNNPLYKKNKEKKYIRKSYYTVCKW